MPPAKPAELAAIMKIENAGFTPDEAASKKAMGERIKKIPDTFIVAHTERGEVAGYVVGPSSPHRYINDELFDEVAPNNPADPYQTILSLAVAPEFRGQGIGSQLLKLFSLVAESQHRGAITLTCLKRLVPFYEGQGYVSEGTAQSTHAGESWYNMIKQLPLGWYKRWINIDQH